MLNLERAVGTLLTGLVFLGCGSSNDSPAMGGGNAIAGATSGGSSAENGAATSKGGAVANESGSGGSAGTGTTNGGATGAGGSVDEQSYIGTLQVIRTLMPPGSTLSSARFDLVQQAAWDARSRGGEPCPEETYGACVVAKCPVQPETEPAPDLPSTDMLDAGTITMTADMGSFSSSGTPTEADHGYTFDSTGSISGHELVTISATGGTISAFSGQVQVPLTPLLLTPSLEGSKGAIDVPVSRTKDFTFTWDARGASERLQLSVVNGAGGGSTYMICNLDVAAGTATFQGGALSQLSAGTRIRLFGLNTAVIETPGGKVRVLAAFEMSSQDKESYPTFVLE
jgi:hypothetical protein